MSRVSQARPPRPVEFYMRNNWDSDKEDIEGSALQDHPEESVDTAGHRDSGRLLSIDLSSSPELELFQPKKLSKLLCEALSKDGSAAEGDHCAPVTTEEARSGDTSPAKRVQEALSSEQVIAESLDQVPPVKPPRRRSQLGQLRRPRVRGDFEQFEGNSSSSVKSEQISLAIVGPSHKYHQDTSSEQFKSSEPRLCLYKRNSSFDSIESDGHTSLSESVSLNDVGLNSCPAARVKSPTFQMNSSSSSSSAHKSTPVEVSSSEVSSASSKRTNKLKLFSNSKGSKSTKSKVEASKSFGTQTPPGWLKVESEQFKDSSFESSPASEWKWNASEQFTGADRGKALICKIQEPFLSWEEQFARRLFVGRRCWSFMSKGQRYNANISSQYASNKLNAKLNRSNKENIETSEPTTATSTPSSLNSSKSKMLMSELKRLRLQNDELQETVREIRDKLEEFTGRLESEDSSSSSVASLMTTMLEAQKERENIVHERLEVAVAERDLAVKQLNQLIDLMLERDELSIDGQSSNAENGSESSEEDEVVYAISKFGANCSKSAISEEVPTMEGLKEQLIETRLQLKHEIKLRTIEKKKAKRLEKVVNSMHEKVARFLFQNFIQTS